MGFGLIKKSTLTPLIYANHGYFEPYEVEALKKESSRKTTPYAQAILKRFMDRYYS